MGNSLVLRSVLTRIIIVFSFLIISNSQLFSQRLNISKKLNVSAEFSYAYGAKNTFINKGMVPISSSMTTPNTTREVQQIFTFSPAINYFILNNILIGGRIVYSKIYQDGKIYPGGAFFVDPETVPADYRKVYSLYGFGITARYYLPGYKMNPFFGLGVDIFQGGESSQTGHRYSFYAGINILLKKNFAFEPYLAVKVNETDNPHLYINAIAAGVRASLYLL